MAPHAQRQRDPLQIKAAKVFEQREWVRQGIAIGEQGRLAQQPFVAINNARQAAELVKAQRGRQRGQQSKCGQLAPVGVQPGPPACHRKAPIAKGGQAQQPAAQPQQRNRQVVDPVELPEEVFQMPADGHDHSQRCQHGQSVSEARCARRPSAGGAPEMATPRTSRAPMLLSSRPTYSPAGCASVASSQATWPASVRNEIPARPGDGALHGRRRKFRWSSARWGSV